MLALGQIKEFQMLKKSSKPQTNSFSCIEMMINGAKKRRMMALCAIKALDNNASKSNVVMFK